MKKTALISFFLALFSSAVFGADSFDELRKKAEAGDANAQFELGLTYQLGKRVPVDNAEALKWIIKAAKQGNVNAQAVLGLMYENGVGVAKNDTEAVTWFHKAADQGNAQAAYSLGVKHDKGQGVPKDINEAVKWYRKAADQGYAAAQYNLGILCNKGQGITKDSDEAMNWFRKAADQGYAAAQFNLGVIYTEGKIVAIDNAEAARWYLKAADQGYDAAQYNVGLMYYNGQGVPKDEIEALARFTLAAMTGNKNAIQNRELLENRLGQQVALLAQRRSKEILAEIEKNKQVAQAGPGKKQYSKANDASAVALKATGTGTIVTTSGHILTAAHVVAGAKSISVVTEKGTKFAAVLRVDAQNDLAVLKIEAEGLKALNVVSSRGVRLGQIVATIGFPNVGIQGFSPKLTKGEISSLNGIADDPRSWQISVPVQPGNSGGPLLDDQGNLIGVVESKLGLKAAEATRDLPQNVAYAVKSAYALALLEPYLEIGSSLNSSSPTAIRFEEMVGLAQQSVVLVLVY